MTYGGDGTDKRLISDETRGKLREASLGNSYALGKKHSEETKRRQSESMKVCSDMELRKLRASNVLTRLWATEAFRDKMKSLNMGNTYNLGKHLSEETKLKLSKLHSGANNPFFLVKLIRKIIKNYFLIYQEKDGQMNHMLIK